MQEKSEKNADGGDFLLGWLSVDNKKGAFREDTPDELQRLVICYYFPVPAFVGTDVADEAGITQG